MPNRFLVDHRQVDRVATAAHPRGLDEGIVLRLYPESIIHRIGDNDIVFERSGHLVGFAGFE